MGKILKISRSLFIIDGLLVIIYFLVLTFNNQIDATQGILSNWPIMIMGIGLTVLGFALTAFFKKNLK